MGTKKAWLEMDEICLINFFKECNFLEKKKKNQDMYMDIIWEGLGRQYNKHEIITRFHHMKIVYFRNKRKFLKDGKAPTYKHFERLAEYFESCNTSTTPVHPHIPVQLPTVPVNLIRDSPTVPVHSEESRHASFSVQSPTGPVSLIRNTPTPPVQDAVSFLSHHSQNRTFNPANSKLSTSKRSIESNHPEGHPASSKLNSSKRSTESMESNNEKRKKVYYEEDAVSFMFDLSKKKTVDPAISSNHPEGHPASSKLSSSKRSMESNNEKRKKVYYEEDAVSFMFDLSKKKTVDPAISSKLSSSKRSLKSMESNNEKSEKDHSVQDGVSFILDLPENRTADLVSSKLNSSKPSLESMESNNKKTKNSSVKKWLEEEEVRVINFYSQHSCLWNPKHDQYYKRTRSSLLDEIVRELEFKFTANEITMKFNSMKASFNDNLRKLKYSKRSGAGADDLYTPTYKYFEEMKFLTDQDEPRPGISSTSMSLLNKENVPPNVARARKAQKEIKTSPLNEKYDQIIEKALKVIEESNVTPNEVTSRLMVIEASFVKMSLPELRAKFNEILQILYK